MTVELGSSYSYQRKGIKTCLIEKKRYVSVRALNRKLAFSLGKQGNI